MASAVPIILKDNQVLLSQRTSDTGLFFSDGGAMLFGEVIDKGSSCTFVNVGDIVFFDSKNSTQFSYDTNYYYILLEDNIISKWDNT